MSSEKTILTIDRNQKSDSEALSSSSLVTILETIGIIYFILGLIATILLFVNSLFLYGIILLISSIIIWMVFLGIARIIKQNMEIKNILLTKEN